MANKDIKKEKEQKYKISLFSNLLMVIQNMLDFDLNISFINEFIQNVNNKYKLNKAELEQIEIYLKDNKILNNINNNEDQKKEDDEKNKSNNIYNLNSINNNEELKSLKDEEKYINGIIESNEDKSINNININIINSVK